MVTELVVQFLGPAQPPAPWSLFQVWGSEAGGEDGPLGQPPR